MLAVSLLGEQMGFFQETHTKLLNFLFPEYHSQLRSPSMKMNALKALLLERGPRGPLLSRTGTGLQGGRRDGTECSVV